MAGRNAWHVQWGGRAIGATNAILIVLVHVPFLRADEPTFVDPPQLAMPVEESPASPPAADLMEFEIGQGNESPPVAPAAKPCSPDKLAALAKAAAASHKALFYDNNFKYLSDPCYQDHLLGDRLKRLNLWDCGILDIGGQYRLRQQSERNIRGLGLTGRDDDFLLQRTRLYANLEVGSWLRFYAEMNDALSMYEQYSPRPIEEDRVELENLFADARLLGGDCGELWARLGRQELLYGAQRTVSPLDWANTRRTFEGYKLFFRGEDWDVDAFWTRPVPNTAGSFNTPDQSQQFMGLYTTLKKYAPQTLEFYYLRLVESDAPTNFDFHTFGAHWLGQHGPWLAEFEGDVQFGSYGSESHSAGAYTFGLGRRFESLLWKPTFWAYYDWASGDATIGNGYHHLFPLAHKYLGFMDLFGRRNIEDLNFLFTAQPTEKFKAVLWWHILHLQNGRDVPYNVNMTPFVTTPGGSRQLGQELDLLGIWTITPRTELGLGYSHFFTGAFYRTNPSPPPYAGNADFFYTQFTVDF